MTTLSESSFPGRAAFGSREERRLYVKKIVIYSLSTCPWCKKAKKYFDEHNVTYDSTDYDLVDTDEQARIVRDMHDLKVAGFPVVKIGRDVVVGYHPEQYEELLGKSGSQ